MAGSKTLGSLEEGVDARVPHDAGAQRQVHHVGRVVARRQPAKAAAAANRAGRGSGMGRGGVCGRSQQAHKAWGGAFMVAAACVQRPHGRHGCVSYRLYLNRPPVSTGALRNVVLERRPQAYRADRWAGACLNPRGTRCMQVPGSTPNCCTLYCTAGSTVQPTCQPPVGPPALPPAPPASARPPPSPSRGRRTRRWASTAAAAGRRTGSPPAPYMAHRQAGVPKARTHARTHHGDDRRQSGGHARAQPNARQPEGRGALRPMRLLRGWMQCIAGGAGAA